MYSQPVFVDGAYWNCEVARSTVGVQLLCKGTRKQPLRTVANQDRVNSVRRLLLANS